MDCAGGSVSTLLPLPSLPLSPGKKDWNGVNEWQSRPRVNVALGVDCTADTAFVLERMSK